ncbi:MAG: lysophospholipid acyltransferase family protein [Clostridia bacterium]|nr:lysophospholipid acyltransferase family protein [Clostridia bacterium]
MLFKFMRMITNFIVRVFFPTKVIGKENLIDEGCIIVSNHYSGWDIPIIYKAIPYKMNILGKKEVVNLKILGKLFKKLGAIPVDRENVKPSTIREVIAVLKKGNKIVVFPEGTRKKPKGEKIGKIKHGASLFALSTNVPVIPVIFDKRPHIFRRNTLMIGKPFNIENLKLNKDNIVKASDIILDKMKEVIKELKEYKINIKKK